MDRLDDALVAVADIDAHQLAVEADETLVLRRPEVDARSTGIGSTFDCADHSNNVCFFESAIISSPVTGFFNVWVTI